MTTENQRLDKSSNRMNIDKGKSLSLLTDNAQSNPIEQEACKFAQEFFVKRK